MDIQKYLDVFEYHSEDRNNDDVKSNFWSFKSDIFTKEYSREYDKLSKVIRESDLDEDSAYLFTVEALEAMKEVIDSEPDKVYNFYNLLSEADLMDYSAPPIYNSQLMEWLAKGQNWTLLEEALNICGWNDGEELMHLIQYAYSHAWEDHYFKVLETIKDD